jgi:hypothetical protein
MSRVNTTCTCTAPGVLRRMAQLPRGLRFLDPKVLDQTAVVIVIKGLQWLPHRGVRQAHRFAPRPIVPPLPRADHHRMDQVGREVAAVVVAPMLGRPIRLLVHSHYRSCVTEQWVAYYGA